MSDTDAQQATPSAELERQIMSSTVPKNEREWWAAREIERLRGAASTEFERGKDIGKAIGWDAAKRDTARLLGLDGSNHQESDKAKS